MTHPKIFSSPDLQELITKRGYMPIGSPVLLEFGFNYPSAEEYSSLVKELQISNADKLEGIEAVAFWCRGAQIDNAEDKNRKYTIVLGLKKA